MKWRYLVLFVIVGVSVSVSASEVVITLPDSVLNYHIRRAREQGQCSATETVQACLTKFADAAVAFVTLGKERSLAALEATLEVR